MAQVKRDELVEIGPVDGVGVMLDQKEPVAAPGNVARHLAVSGYFYFDCGGPSVAGYVLDGHRAVFVQRGSHDAYRGLDAMVSGLDPAQVGERHHDTDGSVPAHAQASAVVEENDAGDAVRVAGFTEQCAYHRVGAARLGDQSPAEGFVVPLKEMPPLPAGRHCLSRAPLDDGPGGLTPGV